MVLYLVPPRFTAADGKPVMFLAKIYVTLKPTVNDPQGLTVQGGLKTLGFSSTESVRVGKYIEVTVREERRSQVEKQIKEMCSKLLANPVIEDYRFELVKLS